MRPLALAILCLLLFGLPASGQEGSAWSGLRLGMGVESVVALVGPPLGSTSGRGYVRLVYDRGADVLLYRGQVVAWTAPRKAS